MRYMDAGGVHLSAIGLGTWQFGSPEWGYGRDYADHEAIAITRRALELGINLIDTAEIYGFGRSERTVGRALAGLGRATRGRARRPPPFLATKLLPVAPVPRVIRQRAVASRRRLGVERIDLYQLHWPNPVFPQAPVMQELARLQRDGVIDHVGVSNYPLGRWQSAQQQLGGPVLSNQVSYSLANRQPDAELVPWAQANDRIVIAYSPLAQGLLSGRYDADHRPSGLTRAGNPLFLEENLDRATRLLDTLREVAAAHDATPAQVALAWVIRHPNVVAIPGASSVAQLEANVAAADLELTDDQNQALTDASNQFRPRTGPAVYPQMVRARLGR
jgi:aryl-alcohol dehydrogenase-like predicted oxidoreductase